jgi:hypothetical protein
MYCEHCGNKKEEDAQFCQNCGKKSYNEEENIISPNLSNSTIDNQDIFYSKEWRQKNSFVLSALPPFDVMVDDKYLYLIKLPKYGGSTTGFILGLLIGNIIGAYIGSSIGESSDTKKRQLYRSEWVNSNDKLISLSYVNDILIKVPVNDLRNNIIFDKSKFILNYNNKKITLGRRVRSFRKPDIKESDRLNQYIKKYVL